MSKFRGLDFKNDEAAFLAHERATIDQALAVLARRGLRMTAPEAIDAIHAARRRGLTFEQFMGLDKKTPDDHGRT
jgi:hypothetical protein